jgi:hypothetical protein
MMFSDTLSLADQDKNDQNAYMGESNPYGEENDHYFRSPMTMRVQME